MAAVVLVFTVFAVTYAYLFGSCGVSAEGVPLLPVASAPILFCSVGVYGIGHPFGVSLGGVVFDAEGHGLFALV